MSDTSDVKILTQNTKTVFNTSAAIERVKIHNNSSFFLRVYYGADAPTDPQSGAGWHETIDPGGTPLCEVVGNSAQAFQNRSFIQSTPYLGIITVMPFLPVGSLVQSGGVVAGGAFCYLTAYYPGEWAQEGGEIEAYVQAAKQPRVQIVTGGVEFGTTLNNGGQTDETFTGVTALRVYTLASLNPSNAPNLFSQNANGVGNILIWVYVYGYWATLRTAGPATASIDYSPVIMLMNSTFTITKQANPFGRFFLQASNFGVDRVALTPTNPILVPVGTTVGNLASGDVICLGIQNRSAATPTGIFEINHYCLGVPDTINATPLEAIQGAFGNQLNPNFAWATDNPQTY